MIRKGERRHLSLRKDNIDKYFFNKRNLGHEEHSDYEVDIHECGFSEEIINQTESLILNVSDPKIIEGLFNTNLNILFKFLVAIFLFKIHNAKIKKVWLISKPFSILFHYLDLGASSG